MAECKNWLESHVRIGHWTGSSSGSTAFLFNSPFDAAVYLCGSAPATREFAALQAGSVVECIHGLYFCGGSAFGLDGASALMKYQRERGIGVNTPGGAIPIIPAAAIFDISAGCEPETPTFDAVLKACRESTPITTNVPVGLVGVGRGATVAKILKANPPIPGGFGHANLCHLNLNVSAFVVANSWGLISKDSKHCGMVADHSTPIDQLFSAGLAATINTNTTLCVVFVNIPCGRNSLTRIAKMATAGIARATRPALTSCDGDLIFVCSVPSEQEVPKTLPYEVIAGTLAADAIEAAILSIAKR